MRIYSRTKNHQFFPGARIGAFIVTNHQAELDDEIASQIVLRHSNYFRVKPWPKSMLIDTEYDPTGVASTTEPLDLAAEPTTDAVSEFDSDDDEEND